MQEHLLLNNAGKCKSFVVSRNVYKYKSAKPDVLNPTYKITGGIALDRVPVSASAPGRNGSLAQSEPILAACVGIMDGVRSWSLMGDVRPCGLPASRAAIAEAEIVMRSAGNFHPEWGYFIPMPGFRHSLRVAAIALAIGATAGAVVVVSLIGPSRSKAYNAPISARALISHADVVASPADAISGAEAAAADTAPPALASLSLGPARSIEMAPAADTATIPASAQANPGAGAVQVRKVPGRARRSRLAGVLKHRRYERGFAPSFQLPQNSRLVRFEQSCCALTMPQTRRHAWEW